MRKINCLHLPKHNLPGMIWNFICSRILAPTHLRIKNGEKELSRKIFLIPQIWTAASGAVWRKLQEQKELLLQQNITTDFVCGRVNIQRILFVKANGRME